MITPAAYDSGVEAWLEGPERVFDLVAEVVVAARDWSGLVLDVGCGTGTAGRRLPCAVVSVDSSLKMLAVARTRSAGAAVGGDVLALPLVDHIADGAVLGFVLNHLPDPAAALREVARVLRPGAPVVASTWAADDARAVPSAVEDVVRGHGWAPPSWYDEFKVAASARSDTPDLLAEAASTAGLRRVEVAAVDVPLALPPEALVAWRLGLPHTAPWLAEQPCPARVVAQAVAAVAALQDPCARVLVLTAEA